MTFAIGPECVDHMDQSCVAVCPVDCITADPLVDRKFYIDPRGCIECGSCEPACPNGAIYPAEGLPIEWTGYIRIDESWYRDPEAARAGVEAMLAEAA